MISNKQISLSFDRGTLLLTNVVRKELPEIVASSVWRWDSRVGAWRCDAIHYAAIRKALVERFGAHFSDNVLAYKTALRLTPLMEALERIRTESATTARSNL